MSVSGSCATTSASIASLLGQAADDARRVAGHVVVRDDVARGAHDDAAAGAGDALRRARRA